VHGIHVRARVPAAPKRVVAVPENRAIPFESRDTWVSFTANPLEIPSVYLIEC
jgi:hypothetical protein